MTKADMLARGTGGDHVVDLDITIGDNDAVNEKFNQLAALGKGRLGKTSLELLAEPLHRCHDLGDGLMLVHVRLQLLLLPLEGLEPFVQRLSTVALFLQRHGPGLIRVAHTPELARKMLDPALQLGATRSAVPEAAMPQLAHARAPARCCLDA
jgi:hypothetical protein